MSYVRKGFYHILVVLLLWHFTMTISCNIVIRMETIVFHFYDYGCSIPYCIIYGNVLLQRQKKVLLHDIHGKIKVKLDNKNYRDEKCMTQTAWIKRTNENYSKENYT